jgi:hypothetical protein
MTARKASRFLAVFLALVVLVIFATGIVCDWSHDGSNDDAHCPYCHLGHQTPAQLVSATSDISLKPVASLLPTADILPVAGSSFSQTAPRAPPV